MKYEVIGFLEYICDMKTKMVTMVLIESLFAMPKSGGKQHLRLRPFESQRRFFGQFVRH